jgi:hypothetical protein
MCGISQRRWDKEEDGQEAAEWAAEANRSQKSSTNDLFKDTPREYT